MPVNNANSEVIRTDVKDGVHAEGFTTAETGSGAPPGQAGDEWTFTASFDEDSEPELPDREALKRAALADEELARKTAEGRADFEAGRYTRLT